MDPYRGNAGKAGTCHARTVPPEDMTPTDLADLASAEVATNPAKAGGNRQRVTGGLFRVTYKTPGYPCFFGLFIEVTLYRIFGAWNTTELYMGVSKNSGTPNWMVYNIVENRKTILITMGWFGGKTHYFWKHPYKNPGYPCIFGSCIGVTCTL